MPSRNRHLSQATAMVAYLCLGCFGARGVAQTNAPVDLSHQPTLFEVGYSHLDTEWRWGYPQVISEFLPNTVHDNLKLFEEYPHYVFNWTG